MTHVITGSCCNDAACVAACPVNCIHPTPEERAYAASEMLYVDPDVCIDCGACADVCPVAAVAPDYELEPEDEPFLALNAAWYSVPERADYSRTPQAPPALVTERPGPLRVAVIGTGPSASYVLEALLGVRGLDVEVTVLERLLTPGGLVRHGVAPDHPATKAVGDGFARLLRRPGVTVHLGVELGTDVSTEDLLAGHHAVVVATGASGARRLDIAGETLPGAHSAVDFVGWYNGHPDHADVAFDLGTERAVVIGNGNVALDVARVLLADADVLRRTDIAPHALDALAGSAVREVVVVGRRGPEHAAFTTGELLRLQHVPGLALAALEADLPDGAGSPGDPVTRFKVDLLRSFAAAADAAPATDRRVVLRFGLTPVEIAGDETVRSLRLQGPVGEEELSTGLVLSAIGYRADPVPGLPFDPESGTVPHSGGRVTGAPGLYVAGWLKRGPSGGIGTNKWCARETVAALVADHDAGRLPVPAGGQVALAGEGVDAWTAIDRREREDGRAEGRPRIKLVRRAEQQAVANGKELRTT